MAGITNIGGGVQSGFDNIIRNRQNGDEVRSKLVEELELDDEDDDDEYE